MPIFIKEFEWTQDDETVKIIIPFDNFVSSRCDVFSSENYIKLHQAPHIFEAFLYSTVKEERSRCLFNGEHVILVFQKSKSETWPQLEAVLSKEGKQKIRLEAVQKSQDNAKAKKEKFLEMQTNLTRQAAEEQFRVHESRRHLFQVAKKQVFEAAVNEITISHGKESAPQKNYNSSPDGSPPIEQIKKFPPPKKSSRLNDAERILPAIRKQESSIEVNFTARSFPTPKRESKVEEEDKWLTMQMEARKLAGFNVNDLQEDEMNPDWLQNKGDSFLSADNFLAAEAAFSHAISLGYKQPEMFTGRAQAHCALGNLHKCIEDASAGLDCTTASAEVRARCHLYRGVALCQLGSPSHGLADLKAARNLSPDDKEVQTQIEKANALLSASS